MRNGIKKKEPIYDNYELQNIIKWFKYEPYSTINNLKQYMEKYPLDVTVYILCVQVLIDINDFKSAKEMLNYIDENFPTETDERLLFHKLRILCLSGDYERARNLYDEHKYELLNVDPKVELFETVYESMHNNNLHRSDFNRYLQNQLIDYSEDAFVNHIKKHLADYNMDLDNPNPSIFGADFPLERVLSEIKELIPNDTKTNFGFYNNFYVFKYDNVGRIDNKLVDYFRVVTINDTNKIITMYPLENGKNLPYIDLNYLNPIYQKPRVRTISRVDKFYNKYGKI